MPGTLDPKLKQALADRLRYYNELGIYDFYRRDTSGALAEYEASGAVATEVPTQPEQREDMSPRRATARAA
ncbi:MAG TPA: uracil-DNA glycosylase, partial [Candidatus Angelobacter sp.]|nr:uracil-DNA glycosylase [Candidatus Angelobacter sp.]